LFMTRKLLALRGSADAVPHTAAAYYTSSRSVSAVSCVTRSTSALF